VIGSDGIATDFGNSGSGIVTGPGQVNVDLAVVKSFSLSRLRGDSTVELRAEFFNAMNTAQFANPDNVFSSPTFGVIAATSVNPRVVQLALKFKF